MRRIIKSVTSSRQQATIAANAKNALLPKKLAIFAAVKAGKINRGCAARTPTNERFKHDDALSIQTYDVERVIADVDADDQIPERFHQGVLLALVSRKSIACRWGESAGRTISSTNIGREIE